MMFATYSKYGCSMDSGGRFRNVLSAVRRRRRMREPKVRAAEEQQCLGIAYFANYPYICVICSHREKYTAGFSSRRFVCSVACGRLGSGDRRLHAFIRSMPTRRRAWRWRAIRCSFIAPCSRAAICSTRSQPIVFRTWHSPAAECLIPSGRLRSTGSKCGGRICRSCAVWGFQNTDTRAWRAAATLWAAWRVRTSSRRRRECPCRA